MDSKDKAYVTLTAELDHITQEEIALIQAKRERIETNWDYWKNMPIVSLGEAIYLSLNLEPKESEIHSQLINDFDFLYPEKKPDIKILRYNAALSALAAGQLTAAPLYKFTIPQYMPCVNLRNFGGWALEIGWDLPQDFPTIKNSKPPLGNNELFVTLPYECPFITGLVAIMRRNYQDPSNQPKQMSVASEIAALLGLKGVDSSTTKTIAAHIKPKGPSSLKKVKPRAK